MTTMTEDDIRRHELSVSILNRLSPEALTEMENSEDQDIKDGINYIKEQAGKYDV